MVSILQVGCVFLVACSLVYLGISFKPTASYFSLARPQPRPILIYAATKFFGSDITSDSVLSQCTSAKTSTLIAALSLVLSFNGNTIYYCDFWMFRLVGWCSITRNAEDFTRADAVVFHNPDFRSMRHKAENKTRNLDTPYVLWGLESPSNGAFIPKKDFINWTMTYRRDADVWGPYGKMVRKSSENDASEVDYDGIWNNKNHSLPPATWLASNCHAANNRTEIVRKLEKLGLDVDKWGRCGRRPLCNARRSKRDGCSELIREYKFYLAFENSNCVDYVTEKFFETLRSREAVPIVLYRKIYEDLNIPSSSYIALSDYPSLAEAVNEINRISDNKTKYLEYHKWREDYTVLTEQNDETGFCALCKKLAERSYLNDEDRYASRKSYRSVQEWHSVGMCNNTLQFI